MTLGNGPVTIRRARTSDIEHLTRFSADMARETEGRVLDLARLSQGTHALIDTDRHGFFLIAEVPLPEAPRVVGQLMVTYEWSDWRNGVFWWIQSVYVEPAWRRRGVFRALHAAVLAQAKADPTVCGLRLYVESDNRTAQDVYRRVGLRPSAYTVYESDFVLNRHALRDRPDEA